MNIRNFSNTFLAHEPVLLNFIFLSDYFNNFQYEVSYQKENSLMFLNYLLIFYSYNNINNSKPVTRELNDSEYVWNEWEFFPYLLKCFVNLSEGCNSEMRMFGPNYQYRCNCKHVSSCDFQNKGICQNDTCLWGFDGPYCQQGKLNYH